MPDGHVSLAKIAGTVKFLSGLIISDVLFAPNFQLNLLSVPKLCLHNNFNVIFKHDKCLIHEKTTLMMIGLTKLIEGLYYLTIQETSTVIATSQTIIPKEAIWNLYGISDWDSLLKCRS